MLRKLDKLWFNLSLLLLLLFFPLNVLFILGHTLHVYYYYS